MTELQRRATAAGFLHALHTSTELYDEWSKTPKDDFAEIGKLIKKTMGSAETPTKADIEAMAAYVDAHLKDEVAEFHKKHPGGPHHVGIVALTQQG